MQRVVRAANGRVTCLGGREEAAIFSHHVAGRKISQRRRITMRPRSEPAVIEIVISDRSANHAERMEVFFIALMPADKLDAQLVCCVGGANELPFIDAEALNQADKWRNGRHADGNE